MLNRFERFIKDGYWDGIFVEGRMRHYKVVHGDLERFLAIKNLRDITLTEFTADMLMDLRYFFTTNMRLWKDIHIYMMTKKNVTFHAAKRYEHDHHQTQKDTGSFQRV